MSKNQPTDPFQALSAVDLAIVNGGRLIPNKGPDAAVIQGIEMLVKTIAEVGQVMSTNGQAQSQQMMQMMQQMMEKRRAGG
jgi:Skp family chaperone for outer membrane proteins